MLTVLLGICTLLLGLDVVETAAAVQSTRAWYEGTPYVGMTKPQVLATLQFLDPQDSANAFAPVPRDLLQLSTPRVHR